MLLRKFSIWPARCGWAGTLLGLALCGASGCKPKPPKPLATPPAVQSDDQRSVYRQAIDQAKALEKQINDRAIDPGEKARLGGPDPTGQDQ